MTEVISDRSIFDAVSSEPQMKMGPLSACWHLSASKPLVPVAAGSPGIEIFRHDGNISPGVTLRVNQDYKWVRLEQKIGHDDLKSGRYRVALRYNYLADDQARTPAVKIIEYEEGIGRTYLHITRNLPAARDDTSITFYVNTGAPTYADREYRFCIELANSSSFTLLDLEITHMGPLDGKDIPDLPSYRQFEFQVSQDLSDLNDTMDSSGLRQNPQNWLPKMLSVALRLEDYQTAWGLCRYIRRRHGRDRTLIAAAAEKMLNTAMALGEVEEARDMMREFSCLGLTPDTAIQLARNLDEGKPPSWLLPSGKPDIFSLNRALERGGQVSFEEMVSLPLPPDEARLVWANYQRQFDDGSYLDQLNAYLEGFDSPFRLSLGDYRRNILRRISFETVRPFTGMTRGPLVSVIVAAYRAEETIGYALRSLLNQTYRDIEILIADDCSDDATSERLRAFAADPRIRLYRGTENQGPYNIRNHLISEARGQIITFHDADDIALPHRISTQLEAMTANGAKVALGSWLRIRESGHLIAFRDGRFLRNCLNSIMFTRQVYETFGPYRSILCGADSEFYEQLRGRLPASNMIALRQPLVLGLWSSASLTRTSGIEADEVGYRAPARRAYAAAMGRQRILGKEILPDQKIDDMAKGLGIYRAPKGLIPV